MKCYEWSSEFDIYLYGVNIYSKSLAEKKYIKGAEVRGFIDRNADEYKKVNGIKVWKPEDIEKFDKENTCIIIMLQNAMQHDGIAEYVADKGIKKIIYVPMKDIGNSVYSYSMTNIYNRFLLEDYLYIGKIPFYKKRKVQSIKNIKEQKYYTIKVCADQIYTNPIECTKGKLNLEIYADVPLISYLPYYNMFDYFSGTEEGSLEEYLQDYGINSCNYSHTYTNDSIIVQRAELYEIWNAHFQNGMQFFISSAPLAKLNAKGYFNLLEGQHRSLFLIRKGIYQLPVRISQKDLSIFLGRKKRVEEIFRKNLEFENKYVKFKYSIMESLLQIQRKLDKKYYQGISIYCIDNFYGYYAFKFWQMGAGKVIVGVKNEEEGYLVKKISDVYENNELEIELIKVDRIKDFCFICVICNDYQLKCQILENARERKNVTVLVDFSLAEIEHIKNRLENFSVISKIFAGDTMKNIYLMQY